LEVDLKRFVSETPGTSRNDAVRPLERLVLMPGARARVL